jgi:hypothetical protein
MRRAAVRPRILLGDAGAAHAVTRAALAIVERNARHGVFVLFMVIEHFKNGDPHPVYTRFRQRGRLAPDGLRYVSSWVTEDLTRCYQVMECEDRALLDTWIAAWTDLVEFEVHDVMTSAEASARVSDA